MWRGGGGDPGGSGIATLCHESTFDSEPERLSQSREGPGAQKGQAQGGRHVYHPEPEVLNPNPSINQMRLQDVAGSHAEQEFQPQTPYTPKALLTHRALRPLKSSRGSQAEHHTPFELSKPSPAPPIASNGNPNGSLPMPGARNPNSPEAQTIAPQSLETPSEPETVL